MKSLEQRSNDRSLLHAWFTLVASLLTSSSNLSTLVMAMWTSPFRVSNFRLSDSVVLSSYCSKDFKSFLLDCSSWFWHPVEWFQGSPSHMIQNYHHSRLASFLSLTYSNKRHEQELLHEKLNYLNTQKRQQITLNYTSQLQKTRPSSSLTADRVNM